MIGKKWKLLWCILFALAFESLAQTDSTFSRSPSDSSKVRDIPDSLVLSDKDPDLTLVKDSIPLGPKKKKIKKKLFYGLKTKKAYTKSGYGTRMAIEQFFVLKKFKKPDPYVPNIYWYDIRKRKIINRKKIDRQFALIPHGPYRKIVGGEVVEEGIYYIGTKHARWEKYDLNYNLLEKTKWRKGWPKSNKVTHYDHKKTKVREVLPYDTEGELNGMYYRFYERGNLQEIGMYKHGKKVGKWTEYYNKRARRKIEIIYPKDYYKDPFEPYTYKEWNKKFKLIYDYKKEQEQKAKDEKKRTEQEKIRKRLNNQ